MQKKQIILAVLDGWGYRADARNNAIAAANTPVFDRLWHMFPHALLDASGPAVGLPHGQMGSSEVGHMTMGTGRVSDVDLVRISKAFANGGAAQNPAFIELFNHVKTYGSTLHAMGLVSDGGVHSHLGHVRAFLQIAKQAGVQKLVIHAFTDGRDTPPQSAEKYLAELQDIMRETGLGVIATVAGRYWAMDRDNNWERIKEAEDAMFECKGNVCRGIAPTDAVKQLYAGGQIDETLKPLVFTGPDGNGHAIQKNDGVFFFNFRADRARQMSEIILQKKQELNLCFVTLTEYSPAFECLVAFPPEKTETTLASELSARGLRQAHIAETEKYAHVTYFFNGGLEIRHHNEDFFLIESVKNVRTYDEAPDMRAREITDRTIQCLADGYDFMLLNIANADMVGHTAVVPAIVRAIETMDRELGRIADAAEACGACLIITADHGNAEYNVDETTGAPHTAHTLNPVPFMLCDFENVGGGKRPQGGPKDMLKDAGGLKDIAPTILEIFNIPPPPSMEGGSLIIK